MIHREGRLVSAQAGPVQRKSAAPRTNEIHSWERAIFTAVLVGALVLGGITGLKSLVSLVP